jgi:hypothetical protein
VAAVAGTDAGVGDMSIASDALVLRDIHQPVAPSWWPPAPGWWLVAAVLAFALAAVAWRHWRRHARRRAHARLFDTMVEHADAPSEKIAAMSELLRRAARRIDPAADTLVGDDWLGFLDRGLKQPVFAAGPGAVLRDGAYRRDVSPLEVIALHSIVRARFLDWMAR